MLYEETTIAGCFLLQPEIYEDSRGYFLETFSQRQFEAHTGQNGLFVQDNQSFSKYGVIRGLHMQTGDYFQSKLVRVPKGSILDVVIDFRKDSASFLEWVAIELTGDNHKQLYVPRGCLHGFSVLSPEAVVAYKVDAYFHRNSELGLRYDDPRFAIDWRIPEADQIVSEKDLNLPFFYQLSPDQIPVTPVS